MEQHPRGIRPIWLGGHYTFRKGAMTLSYKLEDEESLKSSLQGKRRSKGNKLKFLVIMMNFFLGNFDGPKVWCPPNFFIARSIDLHTSRDDKVPWTQDA
jgi:hypothetical protein